MISKKKYRLAPHTQVRQEDFGLLFYTMAGPRLYFLPLKQWLDCSFFQGEHTLKHWFKKQHRTDPSSGLLEKISTCLEQLCKRGVILECQNSSKRSQGTRERDLGNDIGV